MAAVQFFLPYDIAIKPTNVGAPGAKLYVYAYNTTTLRPVYSTSALTTQLTNPVIADGAGKFPAIYLDNALSYKIVITDKQGAPLYTRNPYIPGVAPDSSALAPYQAACEAAAEDATNALDGLVSNGAALVDAAAGSVIASATSAATTATTKAAEAAAAAATATSAATNLQPSATLADARFGLLDPNGNAIPLGTSAGYQYSFGLPECDTIAHLGDSIDEAGYVLKDKAWISILDNFSPYRHVNLGLSGDTAAKVCERLADNRETVVVGSSWQIAITGSTTRSAYNMRYAVVKVWVNDVSVGTPSDWVQNVPKILEMVKAIGAQPALLTEPETTTTYEWDQQVLAANMARRYGADLIDVRSFKDELSAPSGSSNPFWVGVHPGTRSGYIYMAEMLKWVRSLPHPRRSIKVYNLRSTVTVGSLADLVFDTTDAMVAKFKDISVGHKYINPTTENQFEELDKVTWTGGSLTSTILSQRDQYTWLAAGGQLTLTDYALVRISLPGHARTLEGVALELGTNATEAYVLDKMASNTSGTATPPGAWVQQTISGRLIPIKKEQLQRSMRGNELFVLLHKTGGVTFAAPIVHWSGTESVEPRLVRAYHTPGAEMLTTQTLASLTGWTTTGSPATVVPLDLAWGAPRQPGTTTAITGITEVTSANKVGQAKVLTSTNKDFVHYRIRAMARYFTKVLLDRTLSGYTTLDAAQVLDMSTGKALVDSAIGYDTFDMKTLRLTTAINASGVGTPNSYEYQDQLVGLYWTPIDFIVTVPKAAHQSGATLNFNLSCPDGTVQLAWVSMKEVIEYVTRN